MKKTNLMKKTLTLALSLAMTLSLAACGGGNGNAGSFGPEPGSAQMPEPGTVVHVVADADIEDGAGLRHLQLRGRRFPEPDQ